MTALEDVLIDEVHGLLDGWRARYAGRPAEEKHQLLLLALEREQIVAIAYRDDVVAARLTELSVSDALRAVIRQTLVWIWKDEELHAQYLQGALMEAGGAEAMLVAFGRQLQGALAGWVTSTEHHVDPRERPLRTGLASVLVQVASLTGRIPPALRRELRHQSFRRYCELNVVLERTAELAYQRLCELAADDEERATFERIRADEARHTDAFLLLTSAVLESGSLASGHSEVGVIEALGRISPWFLPADHRPLGHERADVSRSFGSGAPVHVRRGRRDDERLVVLREALDAAGLAQCAEAASRAAIRVSFMLGYHRDDRSNVNDPALVAGVAAYLREHGVRDVAVLEAPTVYGQHFDHRSVAEVAEYFGFHDPAYRIVDISDDLCPERYERGFVQQTISATWLDADLRIVMPKLRTDPTEYAHLSLSTLEGMTGAIEDTFYVTRRIDFRSATMMLLDVAPPDFAILDAWAPVADGPFGVMGCRRPARVRAVYAGSDALAVDEAALVDLGVDDPRAAPIVARAHHWFGIPMQTIDVVGDRPPLHTALRGPHRSRSLHLLGAIAYPVYAVLSKRGEYFVPEMDTVAFPEVVPVGAPVHALRWTTQRLFGLRPPDVVRS